MESRTFRAMQLVEERSSTTFKKCSPGAMVSTPFLRKSMPQDRFVKQSKDGNHTFAVRPECRASVAGGLRATQFDNVSPSTASTYRQRVNRMGGVNSRIKMRAWEPGKRVKTHSSAAPSKVQFERLVPRIAGKLKQKEGLDDNAAESKAKKIAKKILRDLQDKRESALAKRYGISKNEAGKLHGKAKRDETGKAVKDEKPHTAKSEWGRAGNREVPRSPLHAATPEEEKRGRRPTNRREQGKLSGVKNSRTAIARSSAEK